MLWEVDRSKWWHLPKLPRHLSPAPRSMEKLCCPCSWSDAGLCLAKNPPLGQIVWELNMQILLLQPLVGVSTRVFPWFECEQPPQTHVFQHLSLDWWHCPGRLYDPWDTDCWADFKEGPVMNLLSDLPWCEQAAPLLRPETELNPLVSCVSGDQEPRDPFLPSIFSESQKKKKKKKATVTIL